MHEKEEIKKITEATFEKALTKNFKKTAKLAKNKKQTLLTTSSFNPAFSLAHFDLEDYYNKTEREIFKKLPKYEKAIKAMEKADLSPLPVYQKLHDAITKNVMKIIKKKRDKYHLRSVEIDEKCVLTYVIESKD